MHNMRQYRPHRHYYGSGTISPLNSCQVRAQRKEQLELETPTNRCFKSAHPTVAATSWLSYFVIPTQDIAPFDNILRRCMKKGSWLRFTPAASANQNVIGDFLREKSEEWLPNLPKWRCYPRFLTCQICTGTERKAGRFRVKPSQ